MAEGRCSSATTPTLSQIVLARCYRVWFEQEFLGAVLYVESWELEKCRCNVMLPFQAYDGEFLCLQGEYTVRCFECLRPYRGSYEFIWNRLLSM